MYSRGCEPLIEIGNNQKWNEGCQGVGPLTTELQEAPIVRQSAWMAPPRTQLQTCNPVAVLTVDTLQLFNGESTDCCSSLEHYFMSFNYSYVPNHSSLSSSQFQIPERRIWYIQLIFLRQVTKVTCFWLAYGWGTLEPGGHLSPWWLWKHVVLTIERLKLWTQTLFLKKCE